MSSPGLDGTISRVPSKISVEDIEGELEELQRQKSAIDDALRIALQSRRGASPSGVFRSGPVFPLKGEERSEWERSIIEDELRKPLYITEDIRNKFAQEDDAAEQRIVNDIRIHMQQIQYLKNKLLARAAISERRAASLQLEERASLSSPGLSSPPLSSQSIVRERPSSKLGASQSLADLNGQPPGTARAIDVNAGIFRLEWLERRIMQLEKQLFGRQAMLEPPPSANPAARRSPAKAPGRESVHQPYARGSSNPAQPRASSTNSRRPFVSYGGHSKPAARNSSAQGPSPHTRTPASPQGRHSSSMVRAQIGPSASVQSLPSIQRSNLHNYSMKPDRMRGDPLQPSQRVYAVQLEAPRSLYNEESEYGQYGDNAYDESDYDRSMATKRREIERLLLQNRQPSRGPETSMRSPSRAELNTSSSIGLRASAPGRPTLPTIAGRRSTAEGTRTVGSRNAYASASESTLGAPRPGVRSWDRPAQPASASKSPARNSMPPRTSGISASSSVILQRDRNASAGPLAARSRAQSEQRFPPRGRQSTSATPVRSPIRSTGAPVQRTNTRSAGPPGRSPVPSRAPLSRSPAPRPIGGYR